MKWFHIVVYVLLFVGGLNWGLVGLFNWNLVSWIFGMGTFLERLIYVLVGLSAVWAIFTHMGECKVCSKK